MIRYQNRSDEKLTSFAKLLKDMPNAQGVCITQEARARRVGEIDLMPWRYALDKYFKSEVSPHPPESFGH